MEKKKKNLLVLGLGSNLGDRATLLRNAVTELKSGPHAVFLADLEVRCSHIYESQAVLPEAAPDDWDKPYYNAVVAGYTELAAQPVMLAIKEIEKRLGRVARGFWGPREIDIDIIALGDEVVQTDMLTIPHCRMLERDFVLIPMKEVAPEWQYPLPGKRQGKTVMELAEPFPEHKNMQKLGKLG